MEKEKESVVVHCEIGGKKSFRLSLPILEQTLERVFGLTQVYLISTKTQEVIVPNEKGEFIIPKNFKEFLINGNVKVHFFFF